MLQIRLNLKGAVVTIDAMSPQRAIARKIVEKGGDCILSAKGNQGSLHDEMKDQFDFATRQIPLEGKRRKSLPKREMRANKDNAYLEQLLSPV